MTMFNSGDIVCHRRSFLQSTAWYTNVPVNGVIRSRTGDSHVSVLWAGRDEAVLIHVTNLIHYNRRHLDL